ncbi:MAG: hypothetical protein Greene041619_67 [Candidatus Peregrinibacteria bacterium Greene0416_19]|nr:MAG: hypothetical protein Greene041619_67 [Candidatus Peregrinibacteria bacterium Greene0416_19]
MRLPPPLSWFYDAWMEFSHALGKLMSFIILTILWIVGFGIYAIIMKIVALVRRPQPTASFWIPATVETAETMKRPF